MQAPEWFGACVDRLTKAYPSWPCSAGTIQVFWDCLADLERGAVERAVASYCAHEDAWPIVAKLRKLAKAPEADARPTASEAWEEMYRHRHAHTRSPQWSSAAVERAARAVNWNDPDWPAEQLPTIRAQFERYYAAIAARSIREAEYREADLLLGISRAGQEDGPRRLL